MPEKLPQYFLDELRARVDIVELIESRFPLKKAGSSFVARCPFHEEKTPSFNVNRIKQFFHCFGCGAHGDVIGFMMQYEHLGFMDAVSALASKVGLSIPVNHVIPEGEANEIRQLYDLQDKAADFFFRQLQSRHPAVQAAKEYLASRNVREETLAQFKIGFSPGVPRLSEQFDERLLKTAGLLIRRDDGSHYERFRDRIVFPIYDTRGRVVGFGGRTISDRQPKYLNSPETPVFKKGQEVYGIFEALKKGSPKPTRWVLVEGYMDVISLVQAGVKGAVATLGTAISQTQIKRLFSYAAEIVLCFDGDNAGKKAAWQAIDIAAPLLEDGRRLKVLMLPEGEDPDSLVQKEGADGFEQRLVAAMPLSDFFFSTLAERHPLESLEARAALSCEAKPYLNKLPNSEFKSMMLRRLHSVLSGYGDRTFPRGGSPRQRRNNGSLAPNPTSGVSLVRRVAALLISNPVLATRVDLVDRAWLRKARRYDKVFSVLFDYIDGCEAPSRPDLMEVLRANIPLDVIRGLESSDTPLRSEEEEAEFLGAINQLRKLRTNTRIDELLKLAALRQMSSIQKEELSALLRTKVE